MKRFAAKFGFIHRRLWRQDGLYRAALLFGPAPLLGCALAAGIWGGLQALTAAPHQPPPPWAKPTAAVAPPGADGAPLALLPARPLPDNDAYGLVGYKPGWGVTIHAMTLGQIMDLDIQRTSLSGFAIDGPSIDMDRIMAAAGPVPSLYIAAGSGWLVARTAGVYAVTLRLERPAGARADCVTRAGLGGHRIVSNIEVDMVLDVAKTFDAGRFDLQPGLYQIAWAFSCWRDNAVVGPGKITVLIGHPGEKDKAPAGAGDIVR